MTEVFTVNRDIHKYELIKLLIAFSIYVFPLIGFTDQIDDSIQSGAKEYQQRCALCHGDNARGNGPYAFALVFKPSDLTKLSISNGGSFPFIETYLKIDGREIAKAHGTRLMPIWGNRYNEESWSLVSPEYASTLARGKIFELLLFLHSLQDNPISE